MWSSIVILSDEWISDEHKLASLAELKIYNLSNNQENVFCNQILQKNTFNMKNTSKYIIF